MRYLLDLLLLLLLVFEMTFFYLPPVLHEIMGVLMIIPILYHLALNRRYVFALGRGRWNGPRGLRLLLNVLLMLACLVTIVSGCLTSSQLFTGLVPFSLRSNPTLYQLHSAAARYFLILAGLHLGMHVTAWWQRWLHLAGITSRPFLSHLLMGGLAVLLGATGAYAAYQDRLWDHLQGVHIFMTPALSYSGPGYALTQAGIIFLFVEFGWFLSLWKGARTK